jgi:hypothetical protein
MFSTQEELSGISPRNGRKVLKKGGSQCDDTLGSLKSSSFFEKNDLQRKSTLFVAKDVTKKETAFELTPRQVIEEESSNPSKLKED